MKYCRLPFGNFYIAPGGDITCCCYKPVLFGNLLESDFASIVNSESAVSFRSRVLARGSHERCRKDCIYLRSGADSNAGMDIETDASSMNNIVLAMDNRCNLSCPSCRLEAFRPTREYTEKLGVIYSKIGQIFHMFKSFGVSSGDFFAMPELLQLVNSIDPASKLSFTVSTNGCLMTPANLGRIRGGWKRIKQFLVSVDAASPETYPINRRGGSFNTLMENVDYVNALRSSKEMSCGMTFNFLVQDYNYREIPAFCELAAEKRAGVFLQNFDRRSNLISVENYARESVTDRAHQHYGDLVDTLRRCAREYRCNIRYSTLPAHLIRDVTEQGEDHG